MEYVGTLLNQIIIMFLLIFIGAVLFKTKKLSMQGSKDLGNLLVNLIIPCVVINSYMTDFSWERLIGLGISFLLAIIALGFSILVSGMIFKKHPIEDFGTAYSNAGFMGIPLISAVLGTEAVFYASAFVALLNALQWTYGIYRMTGDRNTISVKKVLTNPVLISLLIGLVLFVLPFEVPSVLQSVVSTVASTNAPIAMIVIGTYLAQIPFKDMVTDKIVWLSALVRLFLIPGCTLLIFYLVPEQYHLIKLTMLIEAAAPVGANVAIAAQMYGKSYTQAVKSVCLSTLLSVATMPLIITLAEWIW